MDFSSARTLADAVLYEGFLLYPYTASAHKNRLRWQFGVVVPQAHETAGTGEYAHQQTDVLFEAAGPVEIELRLRFLHVRERRVERHVGDTFLPVAELRVAGTRHLPFDESLERDVTLSLRYVPGEAPQSARRDFSFDGDWNGEELCDSPGVIAGRIVRACSPLAGSVTLAAAGTGQDGVARVRARVENTSAVVLAAERGAVLRTAFVSTHMLLGIDGGAFLSPLDPPGPALAATALLANEHLWPVLVGDAGADAQRAPLVLASPIVLGDFPAIAPQSNADAFDGTEIDELLMLSVLSLSDAERAEARATDPRARAIVERAEAFGAPDLARLHGACVPASPERPPAPDAIRSAPESLLIDGIVVAKGSSVRLAPKRRADAWDMFLAGKIATVQAIHQDFEDRTYVAVTVDDDPATEYHAWYGRSFFFEPDEVVALAEPA